MPKITSDTESGLVTITQLPVARVWSPPLS